MNKHMKGILSNGMKYIYIPDPNIMTFTLVVAFKVGSRDETDGDYGYSHLLEHMIFKGTTRRPKAKDISQEFEILSGSFNATTSQSITNYYIKAPDENFEKSLDLLFDISFNSIIRSVDLEMEKKVVVEEFNRMIDSPIASCIESGIKELFEDHPLGQSIIGTKESILSFDRKKVYKYYKKFYTPSNCTVSISGNIGKMTKSKLENLLKKYTKICSNKQNSNTICQNITSDFINPKQSIALKPQSSPKLKVEKRENIQQCAIMIGYPTINRYNTQDIYPLNIAAHILGGGLSSRLFVAVREKAGLAYTINAETISFQDSGLFMITTSIEKDSLLKNNLDKLNDCSQGGLVIILKVMEDILRDGITEDELNRAKTSIVNKLAMSYENTHTIALYYNEMVMMEHNPIISINDYIKGIKNIKLNQVNKVIKQYLTFDKMTISIVGDYTKKQIIDHLSSQFL